MLQNLGSTEIVIILLIVAVLLGGSKLSELARNIGTTTKELKDAKDEYERALNGEDKPKKNKKKKANKSKEEEAQDNG